MKQLEFERSQKDCFFLEKVREYSLRGLSTIDLLIEVAFLYKKELI